MTHYKMLDRVPSVVFISKHNELKLYQGNIVYLNDGDNFELRFFNPLQEKIGVEIIFNGIRKGDGYLVLNPGQDLTLDRFLDEQRKMLFETYKINGNNKEAVEAIEKNGLISFNFYKESGYYNNYNANVNVNYDFPPKPYRTVYTNYTKSTKSRSKGIAGPSGPAGVAGSASAGIYYSNTSNFQSPGVFINEMDQSFLCCSNDMPYATLGNSNGMGPVQTKNTIETGRIEKGEISDQNLKGVNMNFQSSPFHSFSYKLMPYSTMNREIGEIRQYCSECGYRLRKSSWKYCPSCGSKIS